MKYDPHTDLVLTHYPKRTITEIRIPLPLKEIEMSDNLAFSSVEEVQPGYAISFVDTIIWEDLLKKGKHHRLIKQLQDAHYKKLGIKTTLEKSIDTELERYYDLKRLQR